MVLAQKVGQQRSYGAGLVLTIVTLGVYAAYWNYKAHNELYRQFELNRENRDEGMVWYVLGLVLFPFLIPYVWVFASNVSYLRERIGLRRSMTPGRFVGLGGTGIGCFAVAMIMLVVASLILGDSATQEETDAMLAQIGPIALLLAATGAVLLAVAYHGLQRDINELWNAYDARMRYLFAHPEEMLHRPVAELAPTNVQAYASPLRAEIVALRERQPDLRALPELEALASRAEQGDVDSRERAETLLGDVAAVLMERAELMRQNAGLLQEANEIRERIAAGTIYEEELRRRLSELESSDVAARLEVIEQALFAGR